MIVAPNSPSARAKARRQPATTPRHASGSVTAKNILGAEAPSVAAICSSRGLTSAKALRAERTSSGNDMTAIAASTPFQLKRISTPRS